MKTIGKRLLVVVITIIIAVLWQCYGLRYDKNLMSLEQMLKDMAYRRPTGSSRDIKIIGIDEETLAAYGKFEDWSREKLAELVALLNADSGTAPAVIGLDILLMGGQSEDSLADEELVQACKEAGNVIVASKLVYRTKIGQVEDGSYFYDTWHVDMIEQPFEELKAVTRQGFANALMDKDGYVRRTRLAASALEEPQESLACGVYRFYLEQQGETVPKTEEKTVQFLFSGLPGEYEMVSFCDVLEGRIDLRTFRDSIVLIGAYAPGMQDAYYVAAERGSQMYGVEIHANIVEALLENKLVEDVPLTFALALIVAVLAGYALLGQRQKLLSALLTGVSVLVLWPFTGLLLLRFGKLLPLSVVEFGTVTLMLYFVITKYVVERLGKKRMLKAFERYVAPQVVKELGKEEAFEARLGGERREIAVLFVDIRGFTTMSEALPPEQVVEILNEYLDLTSKAIFKNEGTLDKFIGDSTMAVFNAPVDLEDYEYKAVRAAWDMVKGAKALEKKLVERFGKSVQFGIGINCGPAIVGNIGSERRMDYTAIGDTVNTAARLEGSAESGEILISQAVLDAVGERIEAEPVGELALKGKLKKVPTYRVVKLK